MATAFRLLGDIEARVDDQLVDLGHARQQSVLVALLVDANHVVSTDQLVERVWAQRPPQRARETLYGYLYRLRRALADSEDARIIRQAHGYLLTLDPMAVDLHRFRDLIARARAGDTDRESLPLWEQALGLWRGNAFAGMDTPWINGIRDVLDTERLAAELDYTDLRLRYGQHTDLLAELSARAARYPLNEHVTGQLMIALYRGGRQADALAVFDAARRLLATELGIDPGPQLRQLQELVLHGDPDLARPAPSTLPDATDGAAATGDAPGDLDRQQLDRAVRELATAVARQWTAEADMRSLQRPEPVRLKWSSTGRPVTAAPTQDDAEHQKFILHGNLTDVVARFRQLPARQLVVLGEPGAGKTVLAMLFTLGLLADPEPNEPIPVLLPLSSWNPQREHLHTWLATKLLDDYPGLANTATYGPRAATRLIVEGRVLPVLDGLDETPPELHAAAINALDRAIAGGRPLMVTCRSTEYEKAVHHGGAILARAAVVEIEPVAPDDAITFLTARQRVGDNRWESVADHLRTERQGPLAQALSTPLMVDLARTAYTRPTSDPTDLCDTTRFPDQATIEEHLLDAFLPTLYSQGPPPPGDRAIAAPRYRADQALRWLTFLARHLRRMHTRDLAWWQLPHAIPPITRGLVFGLPPALLFALTGLLVGGPVVGSLYGLPMALAGCVTNGMATRPAPRHVEVRFHGTTTRFLGRFVIGVTVGLVFGFAWSLPIGVVLPLATVLGVGIGLHAWLDTPTNANRVASPATVLRQDRVATLAFAVPFALSLGLFYAVALTVSRQSSHTGALAGAFYIGRGLPAGLAAALFGWFLFRHLGALLYGLTGAAVGGLAIPHHTPWALGLVAGTLFAAAIWLTVTPSRSWGAFTLSRAWLALQGQTPLRLTRFLDDAHRRGLLRQAGGIYQFRHIRLQDRLTNTQQQPEPTQT